MTSNLLFSHSVFRRPVLQTCENKGLFGKGLMAKLQEVYALCLTCQLQNLMHLTLFQTISCFYMSAGQAV